MADAEVPKCHSALQNEMMSEEVPYCRHSPTSLAFFGPQPQTERLERNQQILAKKAILHAKLSFENELLGQKRLFFSLIMEGKLDLSPLVGPVHLRVRHRLSGTLEARMSWTRGTFEGQMSWTRDLKIGNVGS